MAKKIKAIVKLQLPAGQANPAPPVGPALGQHGIPIQDFCKQFNDATREMGDTVVPVIITVGEKEEKSQTVAPRTLDGKVKFGMKLDECIDWLSKNRDKKEVSITIP